MASIHQYFETDFSTSVGVHVKFSVNNVPIKATVLYDFSAFLAYFACYVKETNCKFPFFKTLVESLEYGKTQMTLDGKIKLPSAKFFPGQLRVENKENFEIMAQYFGDPSWTSMNELLASRRVFIYSESDLTDEEILQLKEVGNKTGHNVQFRSGKYMNKRTEIEKPLAFISHDSRDKDPVARVIAEYLQRMLCPVWYDEYSLKIGDNLRESIEKGLKECKKCILVLSPSFLSNNGWTKKEFDSIFTREILEEQKLILPIWYKVDKQQVYDYCPSLLNVKGAVWEDLGAEEVCRQLNIAITT